MCRDGGKKKRRKRNFSGGASSVEIFHGRLVLYTNLDNAENMRTGPFDLVQSVRA